jgi:hypothetical protein
MSIPWSSPALSSLLAATTLPLAAQSGLYILRGITVLESEGLETSSGWQ